MAADDSRTWPPDAGADGAVRRRANELLDADGRPPIAHMTPHTLRRTFASILAVCDVPPRRAMYLMGHTDASFTMSVYQQVLDAGLGLHGGARAALGGAPEQARAVSCGTTATGIPPQFPPLAPTRLHAGGDSARSGRPRKCLVCRVISEAAEGTRTLDLLHGKQTL